MCCISLLLNIYPFFPTKGIEIVEQSRQKFAPMNDLETGRLMKEFSSQPKTQELPKGTKELHGSILDDDVQTGKYVHFIK